MVIPKWCSNFWNIFKVILWVAGALVTLEGVFQSYVFLDKYFEQREANKLLIDLTPLKGPEVFFIYKRDPITRISDKTKAPEIIRVNFSGYFKNISDEDIDFGATVNANFTLPPGWTFGGNLFFEDVTGNNQKRIDSSKIVLGPGKILPFQLNMDLKPAPNELLCFYEDCWKLPDDVSSELRINFNYPSVVDESLYVFYLNYDLRNSLIWMDAPIMPNLHWGPI
jgi:hypothetical protein